MNKISLKINNFLVEKDQSLSLEGGSEKENASLLKNIDDDTQILLSDANYSATHEKI